MTIGQQMAEEIKTESAKTRQILERIPADFDYKPHPKSMPLGRLAAHIAELSGWGDSILGLRELNIDMSTWKPWTPATREEIVKKYDENVAALTKLLAGTSDAEMAESWTLKMNGNPMFTMPRTTVVRDFVINHTIHHRAQLGVYLRLKDIALPKTYGPSADEQ
jgi:uncharacterized damage-inducible protein DinB